LLLVRVTHLSLELLTKHNYSATRQRLLFLGDIYIAIKQLAKIFMPDIRKPMFLKVEFK
jgi:hypothetical protein